MLEEELQKTMLAEKGGLDASGGMWQRRLRKGASATR
jgi:hypothetical protein